MDKFIYFATVPKDIQELLARYESPKSETSTWKWIPMEYLDRVGEALKSAGRFPCGIFVAHGFIAGVLQLTKRTPWLSRCMNYDTTGTRNH
jgi:hypothetical protein